MDQETCKKLSVGQERLLMKVVDKEACLLERIRAKFLLMVNPEAEVFVDSMNRIKEESKGFSLKKLENSLWDDIEARIEQEERAAQFLGARRVVIEERPTSSWFSLGIGNLSGAVVAASVVASLFIARDMMNQEVPGIQRSMQRASVEGIESPIRPVRFTQSPSSSVPVQLVRSPMEFESMQSDGEVSFLREREDEDPVILVRIAPEHFDELGNDSLHYEQPRIIEDRGLEPISVSTVGR